MCVFWVFKTDYLPFYCFDLIFVFVFFFSLYFRFVCVSDSCQSKYRVARIVYVFLRVHLHWTKRHSFIHSRSYSYSSSACTFFVIQSVVLALFFFLHCCWLSLFLLLTITVLRIQFKRIEKNPFRNSMAQHNVFAFSVSFSFDECDVEWNFTLCILCFNRIERITHDIFTQMVVVVCRIFCAVELRERTLPLLLWFYFFSLGENASHTFRQNFYSSLCSMCFSSLNRLNNNEIDWQWWTKKK